MTLSDRIRTRTRTRTPEWLRRVHAGELPRVVGGVPREPVATTRPVADGAAEPRRGAGTVADGTAPAIRRGLAA